MLDYVLLAQARKMLTDEATELHYRARTADVHRADRPVEIVGVAVRTTVVAEACDYAADSLHNVLSKADAFLDDEQAREALRHE